MNEDQKKKEDCKSMAGYSDSNNRTDLVYIIWVAQMKDYWYKID